MATLKLKSFRIQNYRSIKDSEWRNLSTDGITILIGQNESGKTTVLEALHSFFTGHIFEDILRSDQSLPMVHCVFTIEEGARLVDFINSDKLPEDIRLKIEDNKQFVLCRSWREDKTSEVTLGEGPVYKYFTDKNAIESSIAKEIIKEANTIIQNSNLSLQKLKDTENQKSDEEEVLAELRGIKDAAFRNLKKAKDSDTKSSAEKELDQAKVRYEEQEKIVKEITDAFKLQKEQTDNLSEKLDVCSNLQNTLKELKRVSDIVEEKRREVQDYRYLAELSTNSKDRKRNQNKQDRTFKDLARFIENEEKLNRRKDFELIVTKLVIREKQVLRIAEKKAKAEIEMQDRFYNLQELGSILFKYVPVFEFFEDFSGLLPNTIDLEDILNGNEHVEGYKAAKNFLLLAGLDATFFRENNQRILKQRIESLNTDVTINFQDYWSQQVGKNSKIKLHFELEHYDYNTPDKKGKPYLEFWIKDNQNRLYPKQRSRGVRWFLSFYLELKAAEAENETNRVLLIDEPGLSLHARAQEDVLKVFEDLKKTMQIVYCTHSPHLVKKDKLFRVLAVQREDETDDRSETKVFDPGLLSKASADTLTPVYSLLGVRVNEQQFIQKQNNIILSDTTTYYYLKWMSGFSDLPIQVNFVPATGENTIPLLINMLIGWSVDFKVLLFGANRNSLLKEINDSTLINGGVDQSENICHVTDFELVEDVFSTLDFKKYILNKREGITESNSEYITKNGLSRKILATNFVNKLEDTNITEIKFDETTITNVNKLFNQLLNYNKT